MRKLCFLFFALALLPGTAGAATLCNTKVGFSADRMLVFDGHSYSGKIWAMPGEERHEQAIEAFHPIFLLHGDSPLGQVVVPQLKTVVEFVMPRSLRLLDSPQLRKHPSGQEPVNGIATTKYAIDESVPDGHAAGMLWLSPDGIPMKFAGSFDPTHGKRVTVKWELSHVKIGPQPGSLFEAPSGYTKLPAEAVAPLLGLRLKSAKH